jgi:hypothetical protein
MRFPAPESTVASGRSIDLDRSSLLHMNVTRHPTSAWALQQLREAVGCETNHQYLLHDRDTIFARSLDESIANLGAEGTEITTPKSQGECDLRTGHRHDSPRVFGSVDSDL